MARRDGEHEGFVLKNRPRLSLVVLGRQSYTPGYSWQLPYT